MANQYISPEARFNLRQLSSQVQSDDFHTKSISIKLQNDMPSELYLWYVLNKKNIYLITTNLQYGTEDVNDNAKYLNDRCHH